MVQFNLLPDIKLKYIKTQRIKHLVTFISMIVSAASIGLLLISLFTVYVVQRQTLKDIDKKIDNSNKQLSAIQDVDKILTVQNQLRTLTSLHEDKPAASRIFSYIEQITPARVGLSNLQLDFEANTLSVGGAAPTLDDVKNYANAFKMATYSIGDDGQKQMAFDDVVLSSFSRNEKGTSFTITSKFADELFDNTESIKLGTNAGGAPESPFRGGE